MPTWQQTETIKDNDAALTVRHTLVRLHQSLNISTNNMLKEETFGQKLPRAVRRVDSMSPLGSHVEALRLGHPGTESDRFLCST